MAEHFRESAYPGFVDAIEQNREANGVSSETLELMTGGSTACIRYQGAFLTELTLNNGPTRSASLLYSDPAEQLSKPKLTASHLMMPVGPYEGAGGQHGFPRWASYSQTERDAALGAYDYGVLEAQMYDLPLTLERSYELNPRQFHVSATVQNNSRYSRHTSMGEHYYFNLPGGPDSVEGVTVEGYSIGDLLEPDAVDLIQQGEPQFWRGFTGRAAVAIPGMGDIHLRASLEGAAAQAGDPESLGMLLWQRPGKSFICLEPTVGLDSSEDGQFANTGLVIPAYGRVALNTTITII